MLEIHLCEHSGNIDLVDVSQTTDAERVRDLFRRTPHTISLFCKPFVYFDIFCSHFVCPDHFVFIIFFKSQIILQIVILYHFFANCCSRSNYSANCRSRSLFANCCSGSNCFASFRFSSLLANCSTECKEDQSETVLRFPIELFRNLCSVLLFAAYLDQR